MEIFILYVLVEFCKIRKITQFLMYFFSIKNFKHLHEKVLERDGHSLHDSRKVNLLGQGHFFIAHLLGAISQLHSQVRLR